MKHAEFPLLSAINSPFDLRLLSVEQLSHLAIELRHYLLYSLDQSGGHFAANLGTVELTLALHYLYDTPHDRLVWDVGHQAYVHKILTGRREQFSTIRQHKGLSPFPSRTESIFDSFGVGHSSTSISAALGMAMATADMEKPPHTVAIIGDGAMTAGLAFEALNHAGSLKANLLIILNDNEMSISENVGALSHYLTRILSGKIYMTMREEGKKILSIIPKIRELARRTEEHVKGMLIPGTFFEELGIHYHGPIDGHDLSILLPTLRNLKDLKGPQLIHIVTKKGKGYPSAEKDPIKFHAVNRGFLSASIVSPPKNKTYSNIFGEWLCDMAEKDERLIAITPAMCQGSDLVNFSLRFPSRYFDVGIAEQHAVTFAAGLACAGKKPVVSIYSTFLQRAYDQVIHDVALQNLPVLFAIDRAGIVGGDGMTHQGVFDNSFLRCIPHLILMAASDENELRQMLYTGFQQEGPCAVRYPRGTGIGAVVNTAMNPLPIGKAQIKRRGKKIALLSFGPLLEIALLLAEKWNATVVNMRFIKPLDTELINELAGTHQLLVTLEENTIEGGAGSGVSQFLHQQNLSCDLLLIGLPDRPLDHGDPALILSEYSLDMPGIQRSIETSPQFQRLNITSLSIVPERT